MDMKKLVWLMEVSLELEVWLNMINIKTKGLVEKSVLQLQMRLFDTLINTYSAAIKNLPSVNNQFVAEARTL